MTQLMSPAWSPCRSRPCCYTCAEGSLETCKRVLNVQGPFADRSSELETCKSLCKAKLCVITIVRILTYTRTVGGRCAWHALCRVDGGRGYARACLHVRAYVLFHDACATARRTHVSARMCHACIHKVMRAGHSHANSSSL